MTNGGMNVPSADAPWRRERIGGWLYCPAFGLVVGCLTVGVLVFAGATTVLFAPNLWTAPTVTSGGDAIPRLQHDEYQAELNKGRVILATIVAMEALLWALMIRAAVRFFRRKRNAPAALIALLIAEIVIHGLILAILAPQTNHSGISMELPVRIFAGNVLAAMVWIPYLRVSKRVRKTFVVD